MDRLSSILHAMWNKFADPQDYRVEKTALSMGFLSMCFQLQLPFELIDGYPVPTVIFKGRPSYFHAFVVLLMCTFSCSLITFLVRQLRPKLAGYCRLITLFSLIAAVAIFCGLAIVNPPPSPSVSSFWTLVSDALFFLFTLL
ncbi:hypothetical protein Nepgr_017083 [Nepenthes gracilis]|uniref:Uncharacterized protein n=1 Tax=Nepenthes gracilis TaxID=150966 RepID=A0AAD3SRR3_NEPGR|nr:hypothetical protein Nepgr_017083 [Nepenthes gracilis]